MTFDLKLREYHKRLFPFAYNIVGDSQEAEDIVQEVLNHFFMTDHSHVHDPVSYLTKSVINRSITAQKRIYSRKQNYRGHWLPVPVATDEAIYASIDKVRIVSYSLLVLLERLNPRERAVFILKESFDFAHDEVAGLLDITPENSRQLYKRAKLKLDQDKTNVSASGVDQTVLLRELTDAMIATDLNRIKQLLAADVLSVSDGGNEHRAAPNVISGQANVARFLQAMFGKYYLDGSTYSFAELNHQPAILFAKDNLLYRCIILQVVEGHIDNVSIIVNPEKLSAISIRKLSRQ